MDIIGTVARVAVGALSLFYGRRLFWLFAAAVGFLAGFAIGQSLFPDVGGLAHLVIGLVVGVAGALLAQLAPSLIAIIFGFLAGGYALQSLVGGLTPLSGAVQWIVYIAGGVIGAILASRAFDVALVVLSSLVGAGTLSAVAGQLLNFQGPTQTVVYVVLAAIGMLVQFGLVRGDKRSS